MGLLLYLLVCFAAPSSDLAVYLTSNARLIALQVLRQQVRKILTFISLIFLGMPELVSDLLNYVFGLLSTGVQIE
jgi:hypothetical protein